MSLEISEILMIVAIIVEGPIVWWLASSRRKEDVNMSALNKINQRIDEIEDNYATKEYVEDKMDHVKEVVNVQFTTIIEELRYIRSRVDESPRNGKD